MIALIDCDIVTYRIGWACEEEENEVFVLATVRGFIADILLNLPEVDLHDYECFITGKGNFRNEYAVTQPYKGNRKDSRKPKWYDAIRNYLIEYFEADVSENEEADDTIGIRFTELDGEGIICSLDKDFDQFAGWHYNFAKNDKYFVTPEEGLLKFYMQFLEGDRVDNILGVHGIGGKKARALLEGLSEREMYEVCVDKLGSEERAIENGRLLYLRHTPNEIWSPPTNG